MSSPVFPEPPMKIPPTTIAAADAAVAKVAAKKDDWLRVSVVDRIGYLRRCIDGVMAVAEGWVADGCRLKGIKAGDALEGEEWLAGPSVTVRNMRLLLQALEAG